MRFSRKNSHGIAIFKFFRIGDGRVNLNRLVFPLFQLINSIFRSKILAEVMDGANLTDVNLTGADLTGAYLTGVTWSNTTCPDGTVTNTGCPQ